MHEKQLHGGKKSDLAKLKHGGRIASKGEHSVQKQSILDNWEPFNGMIEDGIYYVATDYYFPFHKNGEYSRP